MEKEQKQKEQGQFHKVLMDLAENNCFLNFDTFMIREMGFDFHSSDELEAVRRPAMREFRKRTNCYPVASLPTIRKWFGIGKVSRPRREQIFEICLILQVNVTKAEEYLMLGLGESSFELSDYREMIYCYGLENHLSLEFCQNMIEDFEAQMPNISETEDLGEEYLLQEFSHKVKSSSEKFFKWMLENATRFKGYSSASMNCIYKAKGLVIKFV